MAGRHPGGGSGPLRPPVRRPGDRGRCAGGPAAQRRRRSGPGGGQHPPAARLARRGQRGRRPGRAGRPAGQARHRGRRPGGRGEGGPRGRCGPKRSPARPRWCEEAEQIAAESTSWKAAGDRLRDILEEWRTIRGIDRKTDSELWKRYAAARDAFSRRRGAHFASLDADASRRRRSKEELVAQAEALADSTDWTGTANQLRELMASGRARRAPPARPSSGCGNGSAPPRTPTSPAAASTSPPVTPSSAKPWLAGRSWSPRPRRWTWRPTRGPPRPSCGASRPGGTRPGGCAATRPHRWSGGCGRWRRRSPRRWTPRGGGPTLGEPAAGRRCANRSPEARGAAGAGQGRRRSQAHRRGRAGPGHQRQFLRLAERSS